MSRPWGRGPDPMSCPSPDPSFASGRRSFSKAMRSSTGEESLIDYVKEPHDGLVARAARRVIAELQGPEAVLALQQARREAKAAEELAKTIARLLAFVHVDRPKLGEATGQAVFVRQQPETRRIGLELPTRLEWRDSVLTHWFGSQVRGQWPTRPGGIRGGFTAEYVAKSHYRPYVQEAYPTPPSNSRL